MIAVKINLSRFQRRNGKLLRGHLEKLSSTPVCKLESTIFDMKLKHLDLEWRLERPVRAATICFGVLAALFAMAAPFMEASIGRLNFFVCGVGYSAALAFASIGLSILPFPWRRRLFLCLMTFPIFAVLACLAIMAIAYFGFPLSILDFVLPPLMWITVVFLTAIVVPACLGWYSHACTSRRTSDS